MPDPTVNPDDAPPMPPELAMADEPLEHGAVVHYLDRIHMGYGPTLDALAAGETTVADIGQDPPEVVDAVMAVHTWQVTDDEVAEWAMRKLAGAEDRVARYEAMAAAWRARVDEWLDQVTRADRRTAAWFGGHLLAYMVRERERDADRKSIALPSGALSSTKPAKPKVSVVDDELAARWAKANLAPEVVAAVVKEETTWKVYAGIGQHVRTVDNGDGTWSAVDADGKPVPGVVVEPPAIKPKVTPR